MLRYRYSEEFNPPAPFVHVTLTNPTDLSASDLLPAQLDSGSDRTIIPQRIVNDLHLTAVREIPVSSFGGNLAVVFLYYVQIQIRGLGPFGIEAIAAEHEPFVLVGRDLLMHFRIVFDGPKGLLEFDN